MLKNTVAEPFCAAFQKISGSEEVNGYEGDGRVTRLAVEIFFSHSVEEFRRRIF